MRTWLKLALIGVAAPLAVVAAPAEAATYLTLAEGTGTFGNNQVTPLTFSDTFDLGSFAPGAYLFSGTISSSYQTGHRPAQDINFTTVSLNGTPFKIGQTGQFEFRFVTDVLSAARNTLLVSGTSGSAASYSGTLNIASAAGVPEPATWAMMIGGIGMVGGAMRRQRKIRATVSFA